MILYKRGFNMENKTNFLNSVFLVVIFCLLFNCNGFNIDLDSRITHRSSQQGSMFGFTVAMYKYGSSNTLLVGAPKYQTEQPGVLNGGAVLSCSSEFSNDECSYVPFDISGNSVHNLGFVMDNKTNQLFGSTLKTSKEKGIVVACAPNYVWFTDSLKRREPVGTCYVARKELTDFQEFSPCRTVKWGYHRQGSCQAGFDAAISSDGKRLFIGAPGAYYWQGQIHSESLVVENEYFTTGEGPAIEDDQYMGYSVESGDFNGDGQQDMALGVPKGLNYTGKISLYTHNLDWIQNITGEQLGSYFGYCLSVLDFNNDDLDDILVGAPLYADFQDKEMKIEVGKVYVYLQNSAHRFRHSVQYTGTFTKGRFGLSVASLGDINYDDYGDFAVGEPYGGPDNKGVVYIYHGSATNEDLPLESKKAVQIIYAKQVNAGSTFGWSLSGGVDMDGNQYPDLSIGAYETEQAFLLKSRPIIKFSHHSLSFASKGKTIDIKNPNCKIRGQDYICMNLEFCLTYYGVNVDREIEMDLKYQLDTKQKTEQRMFFKSNDQNSLEERIRLQNKSKICKLHVTYVKREIIDKLTPITANVSYSLVESRRQSRSLTPILNQDSTLSRQDSLTIQKNCGPDNICIPDLVLSFNAPSVFEIGTKDMITVSVAVENRGEDAFEASILISEPKGLSFKKYEPQEQASCSTRKIKDNNYIKCDIGNPLPSQQKVGFQILFQQYGELEEPAFTFVVMANSTNEEDPANAHDNVITKVVQAKIDAEILLFGTSDPEILIYNTSNYQVPIRLHENHFGPSLIHKYGLVNKGPAVIDNAEIFILWPIKTVSGRYLLYLLEQPITSGNIRCERITHVNPYNLELISREEKAKAIGLNSLNSTHSADDLAEVSITSGGGSYSSGGGSFSSGGGSYSSSGGSYSSGGESYSSGGVNTYESSGGSHSSRGGSTYESSRGSTLESSGGSSSSGSRSESSLGGAQSGDGGYYISSSGRTHTASGSEGGSRSSSSQIGGASVSNSGSGYSESDFSNILQPGAKDGELRTSLYNPRGSSSGSQSSTNEEEYNRRTGGGGQYSGETNYHSEGTGQQYAGGSSGTYGSSSGGSGSRTHYSKETTYHSGGGVSSGGQSTHVSGGSSGSTGEQYEGGSVYRSGGGGGSHSQSGGGSSGGSRQYSSKTESSSSYSSSSSQDLNRQYDPDTSRAGGIGVHEESYYSSSEYEKSPRTKTSYSASASYSSGSPYSTSQRSTQEDLYQQNEINSRRKRDTHQDFANIVKQCQNNICTRIKCYTGQLQKDEDVYIYIRSRLFVDTLKEFVYPVDNLQITTKMVTKAYVKNYGVDQEYIKVDSKNITTPIRSAKSLSHAPPIPWWVILLATVAGILILLLIILVLWKCGYFKRHRPRHKATIADDSQPLNPSYNASRNGINGHNRGSMPLCPGDQAL